MRISFSNDQICGIYYICSFSNDQICGIYYICSFSLCSTPESIPDIDLIRALLQDLENIRMDRIKTGLTDLATTVADEAVGAVRVCEV